MRRLVVLGALALALISPARAGEVHDALIRGDTDRAMELLKHDSALVRSTDASGRTPLHCAAQYGRGEVVRWLLRHKAEVNATAPGGFTPLHLAADGDVARMLIRAGADLKLKNSWGRTPLQYAAQMRRATVCEAILDSGYPADLSSALMLGKRDLAKKIIKREPNQARQADGGSDLWANTLPLGIAAANGDKEMVELLLKAGAPVNGGTELPEVGPMTPLCNAVWGNHLEIAELLCQAGADCNVTGGKSYPRLLDYAVEHGAVEMAELLIKYGGRPGAQKSPH